MNSSLFGLTQQEIEGIKSVFDQRKAKGQRFRIHIFGSRARGTHQKYSDVDLLVESDPALTDSQWSLIRGDFEESTLPYKMDLVVPEKIFAPYQSQIEAEKRLFLDWF